MPSVEFAEIETARAKAWEIRAYERQAQRDEALARVDQLAQALAKLGPSMDYIGEPDAEIGSSAERWKWRCCDDEFTSHDRGWEDELIDDHLHAETCAYLWAIEHVATFSGGAA